MSTAPPGLTYGIDDRPPPLRTALLGLQHVMVMFTATVGSPLVVARGLHLPPDQVRELLTGCLLGCGVGTMLSAVGAGPIGGRLPLVLGVFAIFIGPTVSIAQTEGLPAAAGALLAGAVGMVLASRFLGLSRRLMPPAVLGAVLLITGVSLLRIAADLLLARGGSGLVAGLGAVALLLALASDRRTRVLAVFSSFAVSYAIAALLGWIDPAPLRSAPWVSLPRLLPFGLAMPSPGAVLEVAACYLVATIETSAQVLAVSAVCGVPGDARRVSGTIAADGVGSMFSVLFGGLPLTSYSQNIGAIRLTGVGSRFVTFACGVILTALSFLPAVAACIALVPSPVLGGILLFVFGVIATVGIDVLAAARSERDRLVLAGAIGLGLATSFSAASLPALLPGYLQLLGRDGIVVGVVAAVALNLILPRTKRDG